MKMTKILAFGLSDADQAMLSVLTHPDEKIFSFSDAAKLPENFIEAEGIEAVIFPLMEENMFMLAICYQAPDRPIIVPVDVGYTTEVLRDFTKTLYRAGGLPPASSVIEAMVDVQTAIEIKHRREEVESVANKELCNMKLDDFVGKWIAYKPGQGVVIAEEQTALFFCKVFNRFGANYGSSVYCTNLPKFHQSFPE